MALLADLVAITAGTHFAVSSKSGDIIPQATQGFFASDTRFLSEFRVLIDGRPLVEVGSGALDHALASFYTTNVHTLRMPAGSISLVRDRFVDSGLHEDINLVNNTAAPLHMELQVIVDADFADVFDVRGARIIKQGKTDVEQRSPGLESAEDPDISLVYRRGEFQRITRIAFSERPRIEGRSAYFDLELQPKEHWKTCVSVAAVVDAETAPISCTETLIGSPFDSHTGSLRRVYRHGDGHEPQVHKHFEMPAIETDVPGIADAYAMAVADLQSLRMEYVPGYGILAAGLPWFMAVFGRDSIISAVQTKLLGQDLMIGTLTTLASLQASTLNDFHESDPGKMPHEIRLGERSIIGDVPHSRYYGTVDATPLYLRLLWETYQWTGDKGVLERYLPAAEACVTWIDKYGDRDGDGFVEYKRRSRAGLRNQGWKDSNDSVSFADGKLAVGPIALAEVQGYAYEAKRNLGQIYNALGRHDEAAIVHASAEELRARFNEAFWMPEEGFYAHALDGHKRQVDSIVSNVGHCLWSGIIDPLRSKAVVQRLMEPDMFSGWGVRTLSTEMARYNPISYHNGSVWPHDNSIIAAGMLQYGYTRQATELAMALLEASMQFPNHRLPELFAGYPRRGHSFPVPYPMANVPQAWACGAVIYFIEIMLGVSVLGDRLVLGGSFERSTRLSMRGVPFRGMKLNL